jgi:beta-glucanase (GH16 family)
VSFCTIKAAHTQSRNRTGSFDSTSNDPVNSYVDDAGLHIVPTLTLQTTEITGSQLLNGYTVNLTRQGICTATDATDCVITSNYTSGTIINPVRSARLTTKGKKTITYGRVEVVAKLPAGDWLWPAIWYVAPFISSLLPFHLFPLDKLPSGLLTLPFLRQDDARRVCLWRVAKKWRD